MSASDYDDYDEEDDLPPTYVYGNGTFVLVDKTRHPSSWSECRTVRYKTYDGTMPDVYICDIISLIPPTPGVYILNQLYHTTPITLQVIWDGGCVVGGHIICAGLIWRDVLPHVCRRDCF